MGWFYKLAKSEAFTLWIVYLLSLSKMILDFSPFLVGILTPLCPFTKPHHIYLHNSAGPLERMLPHCAPLFTESYYICTHILKVIAQKSWDVALQMCRQWKLQQQQMDKSFASKWSCRGKRTILVFCYQNCCDLLWEEIVIVIEKNFWNLLLKAENLKFF